MENTRLGFHFTWNSTLKKQVKQKQIENQSVSFIRRYFQFGYSPITKNDCYICFHGKKSLKY